jgi:2-polyprenyl-3-methyl-5-hydroxy-6-metoxy-1,4-benzoquinol methylase
VASTRDRRSSESAATPERVEPADFKYTRYDDSPESTHNLVVELVPEGSSVLEFGCATGYMSDVLAQRRRCRVTGVELDPQAAAAASAFCERVVVGDAETLDLNDHLGDERFDAVLFADVLEHLRDPAAMLRRARPFVAEGGAVVASIPNIAHISVRLALLGGEFRYRDLGLLDDTHLHFFTRASIVDLFESAGFVVSTWRRRHVDESAAEITPPPDLPDDIRSWLGADPELTTYQFVIRAVPSDSASQLAELRANLREAETDLNKLHRLEDELEDASRELEDASRELKDASRELVLLRNAHLAQSRHLISERLSFADEIARLRKEVDWRKGVMEEYERQLARIHASRAYRYTAPVRRVVATFRGQRG